MKNIAAIRWVVVSRILQGILGTLCKVDAHEYQKALEELETGNVATDQGSMDQRSMDQRSMDQRSMDQRSMDQRSTYSGPVILAINHINFLEVPMLASFGYPRRVTGLAKEESWDNPGLAFLMNTYSAVPLDRDGSYSETFRRVREVMEQGFFMIVAPEGSRSKNGVLQKGKGGIIQLALAAGVPVLPVVHFGGEKVWDNLKHLRRTPFYIRVGRPFRFKCDGRPGKTARAQMTDELMGQLAALLPEKMRGEYAEQALRGTEYLEFL